MVFNKVEELRLSSDQKKRLKWIELYKESGNAGVVCLRCGISRPTLRKWLRRFNDQGIDGLKDESRRPHSTPKLKVTHEIESIILKIRKERTCGVKLLRNELLRLHNISLSLATIHKVLKRNNIKPITRKCRWRKVPKKYNRPVPGDRVQMDVCKIAPSVTSTG